MIRIFISYVVENNKILAKDIVSNISNRLKAELSAIGKSSEIFFCEENISLGDDFEEKIKEALNNCDFFIPILTENYYLSSECSNEIEMAPDNCIIIPLLLRGKWPVNKEPPFNKLNKKQGISIESAQSSGYNSEEFAKFILKLRNELIK